MAKKFIYAPAATKGTHGYCTADCLTGASIPFALTSALTLACVQVCPTASNTKDDAIVFYVDVERLIWSGSDLVD